MLELIRAYARIEQAVGGEIGYNPRAGDFLVAVRKNIVRAQLLAGWDVKDERLYAVRLDALVWNVGLYLEHDADIFVLAVVRHKIALVVGAQRRQFALGLRVWHFFNEPVGYLLRRRFYSAVYRLNAYRGVVNAIGIVIFVCYHRLCLADLPVLGGVLELETQLLFLFIAFDRTARRAEYKQHGAHQSRETAK